MTEQNFTLEDIKDFLEELGYKWTYKIYDRVQGIYRKAKIEDFDRLNSHDLVVKQIKSYEEKKPFYWDLRVTICGSNIFRITQRDDYSQKWKEFLAKKHNDAYEHSNN